ncbi:MAG: hypothetical protein K0S14_1737 [Thermomicrobiales bacterium]|jgi:hypothetical protein|nr:hypothetical protein [Thermomicrobiales bacterium]MCE3275115.1 hypothetical protein [Propionibacteriaceae bacterium]
MAIGVGGTVRSSATPSAGDEAVHGVGEWHGVYRFLGLAHFGYHSVQRLRLHPRLHLTQQPDEGPYPAASSSTRPAARTTVGDHQASCYYRAATRGIRMTDEQSVTDLLAVRDELRDTYHPVDCGPFAFAHLDADSTARQRRCSTT